MTYHDYKRVYVDKSLTLENWQENKILPRGIISGTLIQGASEVKLSKVNQIIKDAEDAAFKAQTGADFGFNKLANPDGWDSAIQNANGDGKGIGRKINCQRCVVAHEARMRGYDVIARMSWGVGDPMRTFGGLLSVFEEPVEIRWRDKEIADVVKSVESVVRDYGEGARAFIQFKWKRLPDNESAGHMIVAECREKGVVRFGDPQTGECDVSSKLKDAIPNTITIMRVDNLKFTENVKRCCVNKE